MKKRNYLIQKITFVLLPILMVSQSLNNFDQDAEPGYWGVENSDNADPALSNTTLTTTCLLYTSPSPRDAHESRMPSSA